MKISSGFKGIPVKPLAYCGFIDHFIKKLSSVMKVKNNLAYLKLKVIKLTQVLGLKPKKSN